MKRKKAIVRILLGCAIGTFIPLAATMLSFAWFYSNPKADDQAIDGEIGLRQYFYAGDGYIGDGSDLYPHEIVTSEHFYNLTRLQNLGVFSEKTYFRIGHVFSDDEAAGAQCLDSSGNRVSVLDMTSFCASRGSLLPIGNEGTPFYGSLDGRNIPIVGLKVAGNPEDVGVFGYTAYTSTLTNLIFKNLEVASNGYSLVDDSSFLYSALIDDIFSEAASGFETASMAFVDGADVSHPLKTTVPYAIADLSTVTEEREINGQTCNVVAGAFVPDFPDMVIGGQEVEFNVTSSTGVLEVDQETGNLIINLSKLPVEFSEGTPVLMNSNISLIASIKLQGIKYARVIQSYSVQIKLAPVVEDGPNILSLTVKCNYVLDEESNPINYSHGYNVGYIVGHADGNVGNCYVYNGTLLFNKNDPNLQQIDSQSEIGLIGKVGNNVTTDIDPTNSDNAKGETGVLNFSHIYSLIREPFVAGDVTFAGYFNTYDAQAQNLTGPKKTFISYAQEPVQGDKYEPRSASSSTFDLYKEYLRSDTDGSHKHYITSAGSFEGLTSETTAGKSYTIPSGTLDKMMNSVDFTWNKIICDGLTEQENRGLGVFKIVTPYSALANDPDIASAIWRNDIGDFSIVRDFPENAKTAIYFSTAECDWRLGGGWDRDTGNITPAIMNTIPSYSNTGSFEYPFSRDFNYLFKLDLNQANNFKIGNDIYNYMYNTDNPFLINYLSSKLIDRQGKPVQPGNKGFGFKVQFAQDSLTPVSSLSCYMEIGQPKQNQLASYTVNGETHYYPPKSITFDIDNPNGANVSIAGCDGDISIYKYNPDDNTEAVEELVTMRSKQNTDANMGRFFTYSYNGSTSTTSTVVEPQGDYMRASNFLYGHIFTLPRGHYVIGSSVKTGSTSAKLYYVCVQGQTNGDLGELEVATIGNYVHDVDFLLKDPTVYAFNGSDESFFAKFSFDGIFTDEIGKIVVDAYPYTDPSTGVTTTYIRTRFNDFITYLLFYCRKNNPAFVINGNELISGQATYDGPYVTFTNWGS